MLALEVPYVVAVAVWPTVAGCRPVSAGSAVVVAVVTEVEVILSQSVFEFFFILKLIVTFYFEVDCRVIFLMKLIAKTISNQTTK